MQLSVVLAAAAALSASLSQVKRLAGCVCCCCCLQRTSKVQRQVHVLHSQGERSCDEELGVPKRRGLQVATAMECSSVDVADTWWVMQGVVTGTRLRHMGGHEPLLQKRRTRQLPAGLVGGPCRAGRKVQHRGQACGVHPALATHATLQGLGLSFAFAMTAFTFFACCIPNKCGVKNKTQATEYPFEGWGIPHPNRSPTPPLKGNASPARTQPPRQLGADCNVQQGASHIE